MGGNTAPLTVSQSVQHMRNTLAALSTSEKRKAVQGLFLNYDGEKLPW
jgi:hypothetical protein